MRCTRFSLWVHDAIIRGVPVPNSDKQLDKKSNDISIIGKIRGILSLTG
jgi:hypothetical protein